MFTTQISFFPDLFENNFLGGKQHNSIFWEMVPPPILVKQDFTLCYFLNLKLDFLGSKSQRYF